MKIGDGLDAKPSNYNRELAVKSSAW